MEIRSLNSMNPAQGPDERAVGVGAQRAAAGKPASVAAPVDSEEQPQAAPTDERLSRAVESINTALQARSPELEFSVDSDSERMVVKVIDRDTKEVIRQMPSEEALEIAKALDRMQSLLIRQTA